MAIIGFEKQIKIVLYETPSRIIDGRENFHFK